MARLTVAELIEKNQEELAKENDNLRKIKNRIKKLEHKQKEFLERQEKQNQQTMIDQLSKMQITSPQELKALLELYSENNLSEEKSGIGSAFTDSNDNNGAN